MSALTPTTPGPVEGPGYDVDQFGNVLAKIHVEDLDEWHWLAAHLEDWLAHASHETVSDYTTLVGPCGPTLDDVVYTLGHMACYLRRIVESGPR